MDYSWARFKRNHTCHYQIPCLDSLVSLVVLDEPLDGLLDVILEAVLRLKAKDIPCLVDAAPVLPDLPGRARPTSRLDALNITNLYGIYFCARAQPSIDTSPF